nr:hypothetical protein [Tanacetum cinerariifolium]
MIKEIDEDEIINLVQSSKQGKAYETAEHRMDLSTASQTDDDKTLAETLVNIKRSATKDKCKAIMQESKPLKKIKKKEMIRRSSKEGESLKRHAEEELGQEQEDEEEIVQQEDVIAKQAEKESSKKAERRLKIKTLKAREDKDKIQKKHDDLEKLTLMDYVEVISAYEELINVIPLAVKSLIVNWKPYFNGDVGYYEIHRADGSYKTYICFKEGSSKEGESLKRHAEEELGQEQEDEEEIVQQEDVIAKQAEKESSKKAKRRLKIKTLKAREDKDKIQKKHDDLEKLTLIDYVEVISAYEEVINVIPLAVKSLIVNWKPYCNGDVGYYEIHRVDGSYKTYICFSEMLNNLIEKI